MVSIVESPRQARCQRNATLLENVTDKKGATEHGGARRYSTLALPAGYVSSETSVAEGFAEEVVSNVANLGGVPRETRPGYDGSRAGSSGLGYGKIVLDLRKRLCCSCGGQEEHGEFEAAEVGCRAKWNGEWEGGTIAVVCASMHQSFADDRKRKREARAEWAYSSHSRNRQRKHRRTATPSSLAARPIFACLFGLRL